MNNGTVYQRNGKRYLLQALTGELFCLFEIGDVNTLVLGKDGKWQYAESELPELLQDFIPFTAPAEVVEKAKKNDKEKKVHDRTAHRSG